MKLYTQLRYLSTGTFAFLAGSAGLQAEEPVKIFASGFEAEVVGDNETDLTQITGNDQETGFDWSDLNDSPGIGGYSIQYTGGEPEDRWARIIDEPGNPDNRVLWFNINEPNASNGNGRVQANLYGNENLKAFTIKNRIFLHSDLQALVDAEDGFGFLTLYEFWNNENWQGDPYPFRISLNLGKKSGAGEPLYFKIDAQKDAAPGTSSWVNLWNYENDYSVPIGQWIEMELTLIEGDADNGYFYFAITPDGGDKQVIFEMTVLTHHPYDPEPDGFSHINPQKLYTSRSRVEAVTAAGGSVQVYWDDFEFWRLDVEDSGPEGDTINISTEAGNGADTRIIGIGSEREFINDGNSSAIGVRNHDWTGGKYVGYLRYDIGDVDRSIQEAALQLTLNEDNTGAEGPLLLYGLVDGYAGGDDGFSDLELGEDWPEGMGKWSPAGAGEINGDRAPGFNEETGEFSDAVIQLGSLDVTGKLKDEMIAFSEADVLEFINGDSDGLVTFILVAGWTSTAEIRLWAKEGSSAKAPNLQLELEPIVTATDVVVTTETGNGADSRVIGIGSDREFINDGNASSIGVRNHDWTGGLYVGYLRFDINSIETDVQDVLLALTFNDDNTGAEGDLLLYGLTDGYAGGDDSVGEPEFGEDWLEGIKKWSPASVGELNGDRAPGFNEDSGTFSDAVVELANVPVTGKLKDEVIEFSSDALIDFVNADTDGLVTFILAAGWDSTAEIRLWSKEGSSLKSPSLTLSIEDVVTPGPDPLPWEDTLVDDVVIDPWFGAFTVAEDGWLAHSELGWIYVETISSSEDMWFYSLALDSWVWSSDQVFPIIFDANSGRWVYYFHLEDIGGWLYDYSTGTWSQF